MIMCDWVLAYDRVVMRIAALAALWYHTREPSTAELRIEDSAPTLLPFTFYLLPYQA